MNQSIPRISTVGAIGASVIKVKWKDRTSDRVDLSGWIAKGGVILAPLQEIEVFDSPRVSEYGASIAWGDDDDLRIDAVHLEQIAAEQRPFGARAAAGLGQGQLRPHNQTGAVFLDFAV